MSKVLVVGAGRSASTLIKYLLDFSEENNWEVIVADRNIDLVNQKIDNHPNGTALFFDVFNDEQRDQVIRNVDIVVSMLPAKMHFLLAKTCLILSKNMVTASYVSKEIASLNRDATSKGILFLNEIGLDPGIDHMSAKKVIDNIHASGGKIDVFKSFCGGLVAPKYDNNPWNYKFTWNPRNVVLAGQGTAQFIEKSQYKYIPYNRLFGRTEQIEVLNTGCFEAYANRDSLSYRDVYNLSYAPTIFRGTLRRPGYCEAWNVFVQLGLTDDSYDLTNVQNMTWYDFINSFLPYNKSQTVQEKLKSYLLITDDIIAKLTWLGLFENHKIGLRQGTPAEILQKLLESKWSLEESDKDMIVMQHQFHYHLNGINKRLHSSLVLEGKNQIHTAMSMTVGLPVAIATKLILQDKIQLSGVQIPVVKQIYDPVLEELKQFNIDFIDEEF